MTVPAKHVSYVGPFEQQLTDLPAPEIRLGKVPLGVVRRREQLGEREVVDGGYDRPHAAQRVELGVQFR
jgi:hypothetical protein